MGDLGLGYESTNLRWESQEESVGLNNYPNGAILDILPFVVMLDNENYFWSNRGIEEKDGFLTNMIQVHLPSGQNRRFL
jgi:hypothetical protein